MFIEKQCPHCKTKLFLEQRDIVKLSKSDCVTLKERNKNFEKILNRKKKLFWFFGKEIYVYDQSLRNRIMNGFNQKIIGKVKCICGKFFVITGENDEY